MSPRKVLIALFALLALPVAAGTQQPPKVARIGYLSLLAGPGRRDEAFRESLRELGYVGGKNLVIEYRWAAGKTERLPELAAELARLKVDVFVTAAVPPTLAARDASPTTPIVMAAVGDPVATGLVRSLARPGGNITGFTIFSSELAGKRLQLLTEAVPRASRVGVLAVKLSDYATKVFVPENEAAARALGVHLRPAFVQGPTEFAGAFSAMVKEGVAALVVQIAPLFLDHRRDIAELAALHRLPAIYERKEFVDVGGLMSYGPDGADSYRRAAQYVDKILRGTRPGDLPIQQPTKFELVVNLKTAKALGLTIPQSVLIRADQVIR